MNDKVEHIDGDGEIGKSGAMLKDELQDVLDNYAGAITNVEAIGCLVLVLLDLYSLAREDQVDDA